jgi:hypothetical protein
MFPSSFNRFQSCRKRSNFKEGINGLRPDRYQLLNLDFLGFNGCCGRMMWVVDDVGYG